MAIDKHKEEKITTLIRTVQELAKASFSDASKRAYMSDWKQFCRFCAKHDLNALPATNETVLLWVAECHGKGKKWASLSRSLTSINTIHTIQGFESIHTTSVRAATRGFKAKNGIKQKKVHAITWPELCLMIQGAWMFCDSKTAIEKRDSAVLSVGWSGAMRRSEICNIKFNDMEFVEQGVLIDIIKSKTDQHGEGHTIAIPSINSRFCPVHLLNVWVEYLKDRKIIDGPVFRSLGMSGKKFSTSNIGGELNPQSVNLIVKRYAKFIAKKKSDVSAHSLRRGFCTFAAELGVPERTIMRHTRHKSVDVMRGYIDRGTIWQDNPLVQMLSGLASTSGRF